MLRAFVVTFFDAFMDIFSSLIFEILFDVESSLKLIQIRLKKKSGEKEGGIVEIGEVEGGEMFKRGQLSSFEVVKNVKNEI